MKSTTTIIAYVFVLMLLISCTRNQSKSISNDEDINLAKIDSTVIDGRIPKPKSIRKQGVQKYIATLHIPSKYVVTIPLEINERKIDIRLLLAKSEDLLRGKNYTIAEIEKGTNSFLPMSAYRCIEGTIELQHWQTINSGSYYYTYGYYKDKEFKENEFVSRKRMTFRNGDYNFITIIDMDNDGYEDLLILDLESSMRDNDMYQFYKWSEKESKFIFVPDFFDKAAFYGWDKTGKYLITGVSDSRERKLYKNKIVRGKLKTIDQCVEYAVSDKQCW
ncbi:hypothetical protein [Sphingobacterium detergens]|uniref:Uncharacterized protein n=1 Tax=Sphingobacterium detergens TaxID=1145106 RepID=A0A420BH43_SPHD1|nr:hypothetical protein [Sphingobacterium detergens]RKE56064.1 hypothetical protein DFQ12_0916 [Sphingobacterium detergens]